MNPTRGNLIFSYVYQHHIIPKELGKYKVAGFRLTSFILRFTRLVVKFLEDGVPF